MKTSKILQLDTALVQKPYYSVWSVPEKPKMVENDWDIYELTQFFMVTRSMIFLSTRVCLWEEFIAVRHDSVHAIFLGKEKEKDSIKTILVAIKKNKWEKVLIRFNGSPWQITQDFTLQSSKGILRPKNEIQMKDFRIFRMTDAFSRKVPLVKYFVSFVSVEGKIHQILQWCFRISDS